MKIEADDKIVQVRVLNNNQEIKFPRNAFEKRGFFKHTFFTPQTEEISLITAIISIVEYNPNAAAEIDTEYSSMVSLRDGRPLRTVDLTEGNELRLQIINQRLVGINGSVSEVRFLLT